MASLWGAQTAAYCMANSSQPQVGQSVVASSTAWLGAPPGWRCPELAALPTVVPCQALAEGLRAGLPAQESGVAQLRLYAPVVLSNQLERWSACLQLPGGSSAAQAAPGALVPCWAALGPAGSPGTAQLMLSDGDLKAGGRLQLSQQGAQLVVLQTPGRAPKPLQVTMQSMLNSRQLGMPVRMARRRLSVVRSTCKLAWRCGLLADGLTLPACVPGGAEPGAQALLSLELRAAAEAQPGAAAQPWQPGCTTRITLRPWLRISNLLAQAICVQLVGAVLPGAVKVQVGTLRRAWLVPVPAGFSGPAFATAAGVLPGGNPAASSARG